MGEITSYVTREVRWFVNRPVTEADRWFETLPPAAYTFESREDIYLVLPGSNDLGMKFRENRLEVKYRLGESRPREVAPGIHGRFETWEKLSFASNPEVCSSGLPNESRVTRIPVIKNRKATMIETVDDRVSFHSLEPPVTEGIQLEYTELQVLGSAWYTLGLEWPRGTCFTLPPQLLSNLLACPVFKEKTSMGYPEFLQQNAQLKNGL